METITITFGDVAENHVGMQKIGNLSTNGISCDELKNIYNTLPLDVLGELVNLNTVENSPEACVLIIRNGCNFLNIDKTLLFTELMNLQWDTKAKMYGRVVNKKARYNLCFSDQAQDPDYENGKGRIISWSEVNLLTELRNKIMSLVNDNNLQAEGNLYYDYSKCGIGFHGDAERKKVIAVRLGHQMPIVYQWYYKNNKVGEPINLVLNDGDIYFMSEKAVGFDWKKPNTLTLRHSAGCSKYTV